MGAAPIMHLYNQATTEVLAKHGVKAWVRLQRVIVCAMTRSNLTPKEKD